VLSLDVELADAEQRFGAGAHRGADEGRPGAPATADDPTAADDPASDPDHPDPATEHETELSSGLLVDVRA
jgi:hypothetical protein